MRWVTHWRPLTYTSSSDRSRNRRSLRGSPDARVNGRLLGGDRAFALRSVASSACPLLLGPVAVIDDLPVQRRAAHVDPDQPRADVVYHRRAFRAVGRAAHRDAHLGRRLRVDLQSQLQGIAGDPGHHRLGRRLPRRAAAGAGGGSAAIPPRGPARWSGYRRQPAPAPAQRHPHQPTSRARSRFAPRISRTQSKKMRRPEASSSVRAPPNWPLPTHAAVDRG